MFMSEVLCATCQWIPVPWDSVGGTLETNLSLKKGTRSEAVQSNINFEVSHRAETVFENEKGAMCAGQGIQVVLILIPLCTVPARDVRVGV